MRMHLQASTRALPGTHRRRTGEGQNFEAVIGGEHVSAVTLARQDGERACAASQGVITRVRGFPKVQTHWRVE